MSQQGNGRGTRSRGRAAPKPPKETGFPELRKPGRPGGPGVPGANEPTTPGPTNPRAWGNAPNAWAKPQQQQQQQPQQQQQQQGGYRGQQYPQQQGQYRQQGYQQGNGQYQQRQRPPQEQGQQYQQRNRTPQDQGQQYQQRNRAPQDQGQQYQQRNRAPQDQGQQYQQRNRAPQDQGQQYQQRRRSPQDQQQEQQHQQRRRSPQDQQHQQRRRSPQDQQQQEQQHQQRRRSPQDQQQQEQQRHHTQEQQYQQGAISRRQPEQQEQQQQQSGASFQQMKPKGVGGSKAPSAEATLGSDFKDLSLVPSSVGRGSSRGGFGKPLEDTFETLVTRPKDLNQKLGTTGLSVNLKANYFVLETHTDWCLYHYHVDFSPEEDRTAVRKRLVRVHKERIGGYIFDGSALFTSARLPPDLLELFSMREEDDTTMKINLKLVADLALGDHHYIQLFNILMRQAMGLLRLNLIGRNFFDALSKTSVPEYNMEIWPGYVTSIRQHENKILMCVEITHKVLRTDTVLDLYRSSCGNPNGNGVFLKLIVGQIVLTNYNQRTYRVDDVDFSSNPNSIFKLKTGEEISYKEYIRKKYQIRIRDDNQPMLISRPKARDIRAGMSELVYLIPELCHMTGLTDDMRNNFNLMRTLANTTRVDPRTRVQRLLNFNNRLRNEPALVNQFGQWNLRLSQDLVNFSGRQLQREDIYLEPERPVTWETNNLNGDWSREMKGKKMLISASLTKWIVVYPKKVKNSLDDFIALIIRTSLPMNFKVSPPMHFAIEDDRPGTLVTTLENLIGTHNPQLVMTIVSNNRGDRYSAIKKKCCVDRAVASQVVVARTLSNKTVMSIATKVSIQMNCKLGGAPWTVAIPLSGLMVFGFDVCHDSNSRGKSYGALVGSLNRNLTRYFSAASAHVSGEELSNDLVSNVVLALHKYKEFNKGALPERIVFYRDGVGDGNIPYVLQQEVENLKKRLNEIYHPKVPKMAFIIVSKRINTRIFTRDNQNPGPGTIVDDVITLPHRYDFFLVSQSVRQGTVSPTSYNIISDNVGLKPDQIQRLTYKLTHMYYNWSGTVRVPAQVQYAHKLAFLVGQALHVPPSSILSDYLYFL